MKLAWYWSRLRQMAPAEIGGRLLDQGRKAAWRRRRSKPGDPPNVPGLSSSPRFVGELDGEIGVASAAREELIASADSILAGRWPVFQRAWDTHALDWFTDPKTGTKAPQAKYAFSINHRDENEVGNIKYVWEPSRHHPVSVLAAAFRITGDERYGQYALEMLESWWKANPFLSGVHWTSAIEVGVRLVSWVWTRRLLSPFPGIETEFEGNPLFQAQLRSHQEFLQNFSSRGSSANNHLVVEMVGQYLASSAFPLFEESPRWAARSKSVIEREIRRQTFADGFNRELATSYHAFSTEFFLLALLEGELQSDSYSAGGWEILRTSFDALAAILDVRLRPPRQGDDDDAQSLLLDGPSFDRWQSLLATGADLFGAPAWWPKPEKPDVRSAVLATLPRPPQPVADQSVLGRQAPSLAESGIGILRRVVDGAEIWCRFDHGPHGFTGIAGHAHADALSIELRVDGTEVLADPGTYCYHGDPEWRRYFRSTAAHNTITVDGLDQSINGGPFLWINHATTETIKRDVGRISARHFGYARLKPSVVHSRTVEVSDDVLIEDRIDGAGDRTVAMRYHLGPAISVELDGVEARLTWDGGSAEMLLPPELEWEAKKGGPPGEGGWYSAAFDHMEPAWTLRGRGKVDSLVRLRTSFRLRSLVGQRSLERGEA